MSNKDINPIRCVGTGFIALDIIRTSTDGNTMLEKCYAGGSCGNVLAILSYLGVRSSAVGRIGKDVAGEKLLTDLNLFKVDVKHLVSEHGHRTPIVIQESRIDRHGNPRHRFFRKCPLCGVRMPGYRSLRAVDALKIASELPPHRFFFFDRVTRGNIELAQRSRKQGAIVVFEPPGIKNEDLFIECLQVSHVLKYSRERFSSSRLLILDTLIARARPQLEIATLGAEGLRFRICATARTTGRKGKWITLPALTAPTIRDSAGSGDWCTAALISRLAEGVPSEVLEDVDGLTDILQFGQALAALNCAYEGARGMMYAMTRTKVIRAGKRLLAREMPRLPKNSVLPTTSLGSEHACVLCAQI